MYFDVCGCKRHREFLDSAEGFGDPLPGPSLRHELHHYSDYDESSVIIIAAIVELIRQGNRFAARSICIDERGFGFKSVLCLSRWQTWIIVTTARISSIAVAPSSSRQLQACPAKSWNPRRPAVVRKRAGEMASCEAATPGWFSAFGRGKTIHFQDRLFALSRPREDLPFSVRFSGPLYGVPLY